MRIYIASSWRNEHGVAMLTEKLRAAGHVVASWIENAKTIKSVSEYANFRKWLWSRDGETAFKHDTSGALECDLFILYTYAGNDAHAEMGIAWGRGVPIFGLEQKGIEDGIMLRMIECWYENIDLLVTAINRRAEQLANRPGDEMSF